MSKGIPTFPAAQLDLSYDSDLAMLSDAVYASKDDLISAKTGGGVKNAELPLNWSLLGGNERLERDNFRDDRATGLTAATFEIEGDLDKRLVIAFRGSDEAQDWLGPNVRLAADGDLLGAVGVSGPKTEHTQKQMGDVQRAAVDPISRVFGSDRGSKDWDPQIEAALDYALAMHRKYGADHKIEVTGHSLGGAHAQIVAHTFGWGGRTFDAPGAKNIIESDGYEKWCKKNSVTPAGAPDYEHGTVQQASLLNYTVNNSVVNERTGAHIGPKLSISSLAGRQGVLEHGQWAVGLIAGAIAETPLLDQTVGKVIGPGSKWVEYLSKGAAITADANERHDMTRISRAFQEDVANGRTLPRQYGDVGPAEDGSRRLACDPAQPSHPDHTMHETIKTGVQGIYAKHGLPFDESGERHVAALLANAKQSGLTRIDHVVEGVGAKSGADIFVVEGDLRDPANKRALVNTDVAAQIPVEKSIQQIDAANQRQGQLAQEQSQEQTRTVAPRTV